jgi:tetratricopeptide (TPR) repeat protein
MSAPTKDRVIRHRHSAVRTIVVAVGLLLAVHVAFAADSFYLRQLREGSDDFNRRDFAAAVLHLRLACFGLLDEPELLADGLARLALAQGGVGDLEGVRGTFQRLVEIEERFGAYGKANISADMRKALEDLFVATIPETTLRATPAFARLVPSPQQRVAALPPKQRRAELERLVRQEPREAAWPAMLAELELEEGNPKRAFAVAEQAVALAPDSPSALRVHGLAAAASRRWTTAYADLSTLGTATGDATVAAALLESLLELGRTAEAVELFGHLPESMRHQPAIASLAERVRQGASAPSAAAAGGAAAAGAPTSGAATAPAAGAVAAPAPSLDEELTRSRDLVGLGKVGEAYAVARAAADANPGSAEAQHAAAELAYRNGRWAESRAYFERGGVPGDDQPLRQFYYAVVLVETGDRASAAAVLKRCLPHIRRTDYVKRYEAKILGTGATP